jgi:transposase InsO family protein
VTFAFIAAQKATDPQMNIAWACRTLGVSTSGFYDWTHAQANPCQRRRDDAELVATIRQIHVQSRGTYGSPRVHAELRLGRDIHIGRKRVERLMRAEGLQGVTRRRRRGLTTRDAAAVPNDDLVARQFTPEGPDRLWVADITEHPTDEGRVYLAVVIDAWNRQVIGHSIADHLRAELVVDALDMACWRRRPDPGQTIHHADHGTHHRDDTRRSRRLDRRSRCRCGHRSDPLRPATLNRGPSDHAGYTTRPSVIVSPPAPSTGGLRSGSFARC